MDDKHKLGNSIGYLAFLLVGFFEKGIYAALLPKINLMLKNLSESDPGSFDRTEDHFNQSNKFDRGAVIGIQQLYRFDSSRLI